jgi:hypothetical protein
MLGLEVTSPGYQSIYLRRTCRSTNGQGCSAPAALDWMSTGESCSMTTVTSAKVHVGSVDDVQARGCVQVSGGGHGIAVFAHEGRFYAVDNRCRA